MNVSHSVLEQWKHKGSEIEQKAAAALRNERETRDRVQNLEAGMAHVSLILARPFWGRLKWLILGK